LAIPVISKIIQKNNGKFKLMDAKNVSYDGTEIISIKDKIDTVASKVIYFVLKDVGQGVQDYECQFIYGGKIKSIYAIYKAATTDDIIIDVEKASESDRLLNTWTSILSEKLTLNNDPSKQTYTLSNDIVDIKDIFRINILNNNVNISSLTLNIEIMI